MAEIELSRMALDKSTSPEVKAFAQMMIHDHGAAEDKLKSVVSGHAIDWPAQLDDKHRETADDLAKKQGPDFDREYVKAMVEVHQDLAAKLESRLDVKSLAEWKTAAAGRTQRKTLPEPKVEMRRRGSPSQQERQRDHDEGQSVGGRHVPRRAKAPRHRQDARERDEETFDQLKQSLLPESAEGPRFSAQPKTQQYARDQCASWCGY